MSYLHRHRRIVVVPLDGGAASPPPSVNGHFGEENISNNQEKKKTTKIACSKEPTYSSHQTYLRACPDWLLALDLLQAQPIPAQ